MAFTIYSQTPDGLARQQNFYDEKFGDANLANARAQQEAQWRQVQMALAAQATQREQQRHDTDQNWTSIQNALNRDAQLEAADIRASANNQIQDREAFKQGELDFREAQRSAQSGSLPADEKRLKEMYPTLKPPQIKALFNLAGEAAVAKVQMAADNTVRNREAPDESLLEIHGVPKGTDFDKRSRAIISALRAPFESLSTQASDLADAANTAKKVQALRTPIAPTGYGVGSWTRPVTSLEHWLWPGVSSDQMIQPNPDAVDRMSKVVTAADREAASPGGLVSTATGRYANNLSPRWSPALLGASAPPAVQAPPQSLPPNFVPAFANTATAPAVIAPNSPMPLPAPLPQPAPRPMPMPAPMPSGVRLVSVNGRPVAPALEAPAARPASSPIVVTPPVDSHAENLARSRQIQDEDAEIKKNVALMAEVANQLKQYAKSQPALVPDAQKRMAALTARQNWLLTAPHVGPEPPRVASRWW